jgi:hypothetical protein
MRGPCCLLAKLAEASHGYEIFAKKQDNCAKGGEGFIAVRKLKRPIVCICSARLYGSKYQRLVAQPCPRNPFQQLRRAISKPC